MYNSKKDELLAQHRKELGKKYWVIIQCEKDGDPDECVRELAGKYFDHKEAMDEAQSIFTKLDEYCKNLGYRSVSIKDVITDEKLHKNHPRLLKI